jgi:hypothetical protein
MARQQRGRPQPPRRIIVENEDRPAAPFNSIWRLNNWGFGRMRVPQVRDNLVMPEPDEELEGSELTDAERNAAIARERARREGLI